MNTGTNFERWSDAFSSLGPRVALRLQLVSGSSDEKKMAAKAVNSMDDVRQVIEM